MRTRTGWRAGALNALAALAAGAATAVGIVGCSADDNNVLNIVPDSVQISAAASSNVVFTATNGVPPYKWSLVSSSWGSLSSSGAVATFTATSDNGENSVQVKDNDGNIARAFVMGIP